MSATSKIIPLTNKILIAALVVVTGILIYASVVGMEYYLPWSVRTTYVPEKFIIPVLNNGSTVLGYPVDQFLSWQAYDVGEMRFTGWVHLMLLTTFLVALWLASVAITYFSRFFYLVSAALLILVIYLFNLNELQLWGDYGLYLVLGSFIISTYFFNAIRPESKLPLRMASMFLFFLVLIGLFSFFGTQTDMALRGINYGLYAPILLVVILIVFVAGENMSSIMRLVTFNNNSESKNSLLHFGLFGLMYVVLLILLYFEQIGKIELDLVVIDPVVLLLLSCLSAYLNAELRLEKKKEQLPITLIKNWLIPLLSLLAISLLAYARLMGNDSLSEALDYAIIISHLAVGGVYLVYAFINFGPMLIENLKVYKVFYKPKTSPLFLSGIASIIFIAGILLYLSFYPYYQLKAGYYNALGDFELYQQNDFLAEQYYKQGANSDTRNFKSNFQLSRRYQDNRDPVGAVQGLQRTFSKYPSAKGYIGLSNYYESLDQSFNSLFTLKEALGKLPTKEVKNNLALIYKDFQYLDSALYTLNTNVSSNDPVYQGNFSGLLYQFAARGVRSIELDSLINNWEFADAKTMSNLQAVANLQGNVLGVTVEIPNDSILDQQDFLFLYNRGLQVSNDSSIVNLVDRFSAHPDLINWRPYLLFVKAIQLNYLGQLTASFVTMDQLANEDYRKAGYYYYIEALWAARENQLLLSWDYLQLAKEQNYDQNLISELEAAITKTVVIPPLLTPLHAQLREQKPSDPDQTNVQNLVNRARSNAFDEESVLKTLIELKATEGQKQAVYDILLEAISVNRFSVNLLLAYADQAVQIGLSQYGQSALDRIREIVPPNEFAEIKTAFDQRVEDWRIRVLENLPPNTAEE